MNFYAAKRHVRIFPLVLLIFCFTHTIQAQNWVALPPFNTLWPLWSPTLSPVDPLTGMPTPVVTDLSTGTVLPIQPGITWDPDLATPYILFNGPEGLVYWDGLLGGIKPWPPSTLQISVNIAGIIWTLPPTPLVLPAGYADLPVTAPLWLLENVPLAFNYYLYTYPQFIPDPWYPSWNVYYYNPFANEVFSWDIPLVNEIIAGTPSLLSAYDILGYNPNFSFLTASDL
ncbi:MAG: hypothetical protein ACMUIS_05530 [bacterium]